MTTTAIQAEHLEHARRILQLPPEMEREKPVEVHKVLVDVLKDLSLEEINPISLERFLKGQRRFENLPD